MAGLGNGFGTAFLYRGLSSGRMGVVAPVSAVGAAVVPVAVGVLTGERPDALVWARHPDRPPGDLAGRAGSPPPVRRGGCGAPRRRARRDGLRGLFAAIAQIPDDAGFLPLVLNQVVARSPSVPSRRSCSAAPATPARGELWAIGGGLLASLAVLGSWSRPTAATSP